MRFALTEDQAALRDAVRDLLARECKPAVVREAWEGGARRTRGSRRCGRSSPRWACSAPRCRRRRAGSGSAPATLVPLLEEAGRVALPLPIVETAFVAAPLLAAAGDDDAVGRIVEGDLLVACALDGADEVPWAGDAGLILIAERPGGAGRSRGLERRRAAAGARARGVDRRACAAVGVAHRPLRRRGARRQPTRTASRPGSAARSGRRRS